MVSSNPPSAPPAQPAQAQEPGSLRDQPSQQPLNSNRLQLQQPPPAAEANKDPDAPEKKERDYSAELRELMSGALSCLTGHAADSRTAISINVAAQVMPSGSISRADASGPGLTPTELSCIQKLVGALRLNGPIDGAPRSVSAHLTLQSQAPKEKQSKAAAHDDQDDRDENPHDTALKEVNNDPPEVRDEAVREAPEPAEAPEQAPREDTHAE